MKPSMVLICISLFTFVQCQNSDQTTSSFSNVFIFVKDWIQKIEDSKKMYLNTLIDKIILNGDSVNSDPNKERKELENDPVMYNKKCTEKNERYPIPGSCDSYIECQNGRAEKKQCPDGLRYNHNIKSNAYPCLYSTDVQCTPGSILQPPQPTEVCPNQFGYFKTEDRFNCSSYRICENGIGYEYNCPDGLAFNSLTSRCEWPDRVPECNVEAFLGYRCPEVPNLKNLNVSRSYRSPTDCTKYFSCTNGKPRRLACTEYFAFDEISQTCVPANIVNECTDEQKYIAAELIRRNPSGKYVLIVHNNDDEYLHRRSTNLIFRPKFKRRPKII